MEMLYVGKLYCFVWLGLIFLWYFRGKIIVFILLLELYIVGSVIWVEVFLLFVFFEEKRFCFGFWEILWNIEDSIWVYFIFKKMKLIVWKWKLFRCGEKWFEMWLFIFWLENRFGFFFKFISSVRNFCLWMKYVMSVFYRIFIKNGDVVCKKVI